MKILAIVGSPHKEIGNTNQITKEILRETEEAGAETETVFLSDLEINYCTGCANCLIKGDCPQEDDIQEVHNKLFEADGIILGSPVYYLNVTAQMKTFIDRCLPLGHRPRLKGKYGASVSVYAGVGSVEEVTDYMNAVLGSWGVMPVGKVCGYAVKPGEVEEDVLEEARQIGDKMVRAIKEGEVEAVANTFTLLNVPLYSWGLLSPSSPRI